MRFVARLTLPALLAMLPAIPAGGALDSLKSGKANLQSAGALAFGPDAILLVGDSMGATIWAIDTGDRKAASGGNFELAGLDAKVAAMLGSSRDQIAIHDMAVNPVSKNVYVSVSRGLGPAATPVLVRVKRDGGMDELSLDSVRHASVSLPNAPGPDEKDRRGQSKRLEAITDVKYVDGRVIVAGLSNEEFASNLRAIPFPFSKADQGTSVEIFHGAHGRFETNSPVRTFVPYEIQRESYILAAYTCTPLVKFPVAQLKPGVKVMGETIAELGNRNRPLDMIVYKKSGTDYILMNNSSRGVMKMKADGLDKFPPIKQQTDITGVPYQTIESLKGVEQLDAYDNERAIILARSDAGSLDLRTIALP